MKGIWDRLHELSPAEAFGLARSNGDLKMLDHIERVYGSDPLTAAEIILSKCEKISVKVICYCDESYPALLKEIKRPPIVLYALGDADFTDAVSIVGTRKSDAASDEIAGKIARELTEAGCLIVSGMAAGIDRAAHIAALDCGGRTAGILANGIDITYPLSNARLYRRIAETPSSCLLSEYPPGVMAGKWTFVRRNRIISGVSRASVIVKASLRSGAMITAGYAAEQNRELFACPGHSYDESYFGCHKLISDGAHLLSCGGDVIRELRLSSDTQAGLFTKDTSGIRGDDLSERQIFQAPAAAYPSSIGQGQAMFNPSASAKGKYVCGQGGAPPARLPDVIGSSNPLAEKILAVIIEGGISADGIIRATGLGAPEVIEGLTDLEIEGDIERRGAYYFRR